MNIQGSAAACRQRSSTALIGKWMKIKGTRNNDSRHSKRFNAKRKSDRANREGAGHAELTQFSCWG
jgi:hypothetical protein